MQVSVLQLLLTFVIAILTVTEDLIAINLYHTEFLMLFVVCRLLSKLPDHLHMTIPHFGPLLL
jgi:hypothetical protein